MAEKVDVRVKRWISPVRAGVVSTIAEAWRAVDPRGHPHDRRKARSRFRVRLREVTVRLPLPEGHESDSLLFPSSWREVLARRTNVPSAVVVSTNCPKASADGHPGDLPQQFVDVLHIHLCDQTLDAGEVSGALVLPVPASWGKGARVFALSNSGLLEPAQAVGLCGAADGITDLGASQGAYEHDPYLGVLARSISPADKPVRGRVRLTLRMLNMTVPKSAWDGANCADYWVRGFLVHGLRAFRLEPRQADRLLGGRSSAAGLASLFGALAVESGCTVSSVSSSPLSSPIGPVRIVPFYLPQFHATEGNDEWWGRGFTEWTNVTAARPVFRGHRQPFLAGELGFYDLNRPEIQARQSELARRAGVDGFMYYFYWFAGQTELEMPILRHSDRGDALSLPMCLLWANENWTRTWDGTSNNVLRAQDYASVPPESFIDHVLHYFEGPTYLRVDGKAVVAVYRPQEIPDFESVVLAWREVAARRGLELMVLAPELGGAHGGSGAVGLQAGIDGTFGFPPHPFERRVGFNAVVTARDIHPRFRGSLLSYQAMAVDEIDRLAALGLHRYPGVATGWDNTARRQYESTVFVGGNPFTFHRWLLAAAAAVQNRPESQRLVFVNAWNEWAEAAVLEPSRQFGTSYLAAVADISGAGHRAPVGQ